MERLGWPPAQGKGPGNGQNKKRSGAADLEIHQGSLNGGAKSCRVWRRSLSRGSQSRQVLATGRDNGAEIGHAGTRFLVSQPATPGVERSPISVGPEAQCERSETEHRS